MIPLPIDSLQDEGAVAVKASSHPVTILYEFAIKFIVGRGERRGEERRGERCIN
jgi:hypothetical protein